jgi:hypothetical protein
MFAARDESCVRRLCKSAETGAKQCGERAYVSDLLLVHEQKFFLGSSSLFEGFTIARRQ